MAERYTPIPKPKLVFETIGLLFMFGCLLANMSLKSVVWAADQAATNFQQDDVAFDIPSQPLATALQAYCNTASVQILYESYAAIGYMSKPVRGTFTREAALQLLLSGTDLVARFTSANAITIAPPSRDETSVPPPHPLAGADLALGTLQVTEVAADARRLESFTNAIQTDIQTALQKNGRLRGADYRVELKIWIDGSRTIEKAELLRSTGDHERDVAISSTLQGLAISEATPANTPQPIRVMIVARSL
jgi:hypothetical protein